MIELPSEIAYSAIEHAHYGAAFAIVQVAGCDDRARRERLHHLAYADGHGKFAVVATQPRMAGSTEKVFIAHHDLVVGNFRELGC